MSALAKIRAAASRHGLGVVGALHPGPNDKAPDGIATLVLLGPDGPGMWEAFSTSPEASDGAPDAMDRWSRRVIGDLADELGGKALFPFGGPPYQQFQRWAVSGEGAVPSPVGMLASAGRGLWVSYRGALDFAEALVLDEGPQAGPCAPCPAPCRTACPVDAFASGSYDVPRCVAHLRAPEGAACREGCLVRRACPAGATLELPAAQRRFHMDAFLRAHA